MFQEITSHFKSHISKIHILLYKKDFYYVNVGTNIYHVHSSSNKTQMAKAERIKYFLIHIKPYLYSHKLVLIS